MTYSIVSYGSILNFVPLNETAFDRSASMLTWIQTCIGVNNIEKFTPEGWFEEGHGMKGVKNNNDGIWMPYNSKGNFFMIACPFSVRLGVEANRGGCAKTT